MTKDRVILGIDPGSSVTGFGVIKQSKAKISVLDFGAIRPPKSYDLGQKYLVIFEGVEELIKKYKPDAVSIETQFVYKNAQSALKLGMAKGSAVVACAKYAVPTFEYAPKKAKLAVVGTGSASKYQVQKMMQMLLNLSKPPTPEDAADALALALCHAYQKTKEDLSCMST